MIDPPMGGLAVSPAVGLELVQATWLAIADAAEVSCAEYAKQAFALELRDSQDTTELRSESTAHTDPQVAIS